MKENKRISVSLVIILIAILLAVATFLTSVYYKVSGSNTPNKVTSMIEMIYHRDKKVEDSIKFQKKIDSLVMEINRLNSIKTRHDTISIPKYIVLKDTLK
jgi:hypothetical protein